MAAGAAIFIPMGKFLFCGSLSSCLFCSQSLSSSDLLGLDACTLSQDGLTLSFVQLASTGAGVLDDTCSLTAAIAQVEELRTTNLTATNDFNALDQRRVDREDTLNTFAVGDLANGEVFMDACARTSDANAFIGLNAGTRTF